MSSILELFLNIGFYLAGLYVIFLPVVTPILRRIPGRKPKGIIKRLKYITSWGWSFISVAILLIILTAIRDYNDSIEINRQIKIEKSLQAKLDTSYKKQVKDAQLRSKQFQTQRDTLAAISNGLIKRDIAQFQYMTSLQKNLDKWGLTIRDSMITKKHGVPILSSISFTIDSNYAADFKICNSGTGEAFDVNMYFAIMQENPHYQNHLVLVSSEYFTNLDFAVSECYTLTKLLDRKNPSLKKYHYFVVGDYTGGSSKNKKVFSFEWRWSKQIKQWSMVPPIDPQHIYSIIKNMTKQ